MHVQSQAIRDIAYDPSHEALRITFVDGDAYLYVGVPGQVHRSFVDAPSKGRFFAAEIRDRYPYNKLDG